MATAAAAAITENVGRIPALRRDGRAAIPSLAPADARSQRPGGILASRSFLSSRSQRSVIVSLLSAEQFAQPAPAAEQMHLDSSDRGSHQPRYVLDRQVRLVMQHDRRALGPAELAKRRKQRAEPRRKSPRVLWRGPWPRFGAFAF